MEKNTQLKGRKYKPKQKEKDWIKDINNQVKKRDEEAKRMQLSINKNIPSKGSIGNYIFIFLTKRIAKKYNRKVKSVIEKMNPK